VSDSDSEDEEDQGINQVDGGSPESSRNGRQTVYFPLTADMDFNQKLQWTVKLCKYHKDFEVMFKDGKYRPYVTVKDERAVDFLTTKGFEGIVMEKPDGREKSHKVIIYDVPTCIDPEDLPFDERFVWVKRREVKLKGKVEPKPQLIALLKGSVPERVFIPCIGYKYVSVYNETPVLCYKCSKWGHMQYKCYNDFRCRFCGKNHDARECIAKLKDNVKVVPTCCNCGESHNATSWLCKKRPQGNLHKISGGNASEPTRHVQALQGSHQDNVWQRRLEQRQADQASIPGNVTDQLGTVPPTGQVFHANEDVSLRREIDDLKKLMVELQKQIMELHTVIMRPSANVDTTVGTTVDSAAGTVMDGAVGTNESNGNDVVLQDFNLSAVVSEVGHLVELVQAYVDNPKGKVKSKLLKVASSVGNKIQQNGG